MISRLSFFLLVAVTSAAYGMDCPRDDLSSLIYPSCPGFNNPSESYCCYDFKRQTHRCCTQEDFILETGMPILYIVVGVIVLISLFVCCLSCLCCTCCPWYKRRHRGTVYGQNPSSGIIQIIQPAAPQPAQYSAVPAPYPNYGHGTSTTLYNAQPPPYTENAYKQAPYNPNFQH